METTRPAFTHDFLIATARTEIGRRLKSKGIVDKIKSTFSNLDCIMSGLAVFTFKFSSLLQFDKARATDVNIKNSLRRLFELEETPCDTQMRTRLDELTPDLIRPAFTKIFSLLQRGKVLEQFKFLDKYYIISNDGTGSFSSSTIHCKNCCIKEHKDGSKTYHHQMLAAALVHPDQKVVIPFAPEPIYKQDGATKNDCERNASQRWFKDFRREHPHLPVVIVEDGLYANAPHIRDLNAYNLRYLLVCREDDHTYLVDWLAATAPEDKQVLKKTIEGIDHEYELFKDVPLNGSVDAPRVTVIKYKETDHSKKPRPAKRRKKKNEQTQTTENKVLEGGETTDVRVTKWMWVTDLDVTLKNIHEVMRGARARFHIENQAFNVLKNHGYEFEHNFGHGKKNLHHVFSALMMLAFLIDQCLQKLNKRFQEALAKCGAKKYLWERMLHTLYIYDSIPNFETLYDAIVRPPPVSLPSVV